MTTTNTNARLRPLLALTDISKGYRNVDGSLAASVLKGVTLSVYSGETVAVEGASGCGKTTLLQLCGLLDEPDGGRLSFDGEDVAAWDESRRRRFRRDDVGFVFQEHRLLPQLTALENVLLAGLAPEGKPLGASVRARGIELLERVSLGDRMERYPGQLSTGERQRVALARALLNSPRLVLADEPTGSLDRENGLVVFSLLRELARERGSAILMVTHSPEMSALMGRVVRLVGGRALQ